MCSFCGRPRTLRNELHQLGSLVRTIVTCETCHRTLSSTMSVASAEPADALAEELDAAPGKVAEEHPAQSEPVKTAAKPTARPAAKAAAKRKPSPSPAKAAASKTQAEKKTK